MIKRTLYFGNPAYLSLKNAQLVVKLPEIEKSDLLPEHFKKQSERFLLRILVLSFWIINK